MEDEDLDDVDTDSEDDGEDLDKHEAAADPTAVGPSEKSAPGVRFDVDGTVYPVDVSSVANVLESPSPPRRAGAGGQKRKRT